LIAEAKMELLPENVLPEGIYEGLDILLDAVAQLLPENPNLRVLLAGGGPEEGYLREFAAQRGVAHTILFAGRIPHAEIARYYSVVDVLVYPRVSMRLTELVTPLKPLEAMALGRVVVASDVGGHRELIEDGKNGFLFPAGDPDSLSDCLRKVLSGREQWNSVRAYARRFVEEQRSWKRSVAGYAPLYERLTSNPPAGDLARMGA